MVFLVCCVASTARASSFLKKLDAGLSEFNPIGHHLVDPINKAVPRLHLSGYIQLDATVKQIVTGKFVEFPCKFPCLEIYQVISLFKLIQFLKDNDWNNNIIFLKFIDTFVIVKQYIRIYNKNLLRFSWHT